MTLVLGAFIWQTNELLPIGLLPDIASGLTTSVEKSGLLVTGYAWCVVLTAVPITSITRHLDRRILVCLLMGVVSIGNMLSSPSPSYAMMFMLRVLMALGHGVFWSILAGLASQLAPTMTPSRATSAVFTGIAFSLAGGVPLCTALGHWIGWRLTIAGCGSLGLMTLIMALYAIPSTSPQIPKHSVISLKKQPTLLTIVVVTGVLIAAHFTSYTYIVPLLETIAKVTSSASAGYLLIFGIAGVFGNLAAGRVALSSLTKINIGAASIICAQILLINLTEMEIIIILVIALWGFAATWLVVGLQTQVIEIAPHKRDLASSYYVSAFNLGIGTGGVFGGILWTDVSPASLPYASIVLLVVGLIPIFRSK
ncbi:TPA: MFS transporter [Klebsiella oxytoca]